MNILLSLRKKSENSMLELKLLKTMDSELFYENQTLLFTLPLSKVKELVSLAESCLNNKEEKKVLNVSFESEKEKEKLSIYQNHELSLTIDLDKTFKDLFDATSFPLCSLDLSRIDCVVLKKNLEKMMIAS